MVCVLVRSIIPSRKLGDYLSVQVHKSCSLSHTCNSDCTIDINNFIANLHEYINMIAIAAIYFKSIFIKNKYSGYISQSILLKNYLFNSDICI